MEDDVPYKINEISHVNEVIKVEGIFGFQYSQVDFEVEDEGFEGHLEDDNEDGEF